LIDIATTNFSSQGRLQKNFQEGANEKKTEIYSKKNPKNSTIKPLSTISGPRCPHCRRPCFQSHFYLITYSYYRACTNWS